MSDGFGSGLRGLRIQVVVLLGVTLAGCSVLTGFDQYTYGDAWIADGGMDARVDGQTDGGVLGDGARPDGGTACGACDNGNACDGVETCDSMTGTCRPGTPVVCAASDMCHRAGICDPSTGVCGAGAVIACGDGDPCNGTETCDPAMGCVAGTPLCNDGIACTVDSCDSRSGMCTYVANDSLCGASEACRVGPGACGTQPCASDSECSSREPLCRTTMTPSVCCTRTGGCMRVACTTDAACSDGNACNGVETCVSNTCRSGTPPSCADGLDCSVDACVPMTASPGYVCTHLPPDRDGDTYRSSSCGSMTGNDCDDNDSNVHPGAAEICDGVDQDCDRLTDETFTNLGDMCSSGVGRCVQNGMYVCNTAGTGTRCSAIAGNPGVELCGNGADDDCDGMTDEGFNVGNTCTAGTGACMRSGTYVCAVDRMGTRCDTGAGNPGQELCGNGMDDDCDGMIDEGFSSVGSACSAGTGACARAGELICSSDGLSVTCNVSAGSPSTETCNNIDDDCDGLSDEDLQQACWPGGPGRGVGICRDGSQICSTGAWGTCSGYTVPGIESCNGADDDCDGMTDENLTRSCPYTGPTGTAGVGLCRAGSQMCATGSWGTCSGQVLPTPEVCGNGIDEDCNGSDAACPGDTCSTALDLGDGDLTIPVGTNGESDSYRSPLRFQGMNQDISDTDCVPSSSAGRDVFLRFAVRSDTVVQFDAFDSGARVALSIRSGACSSGPALERDGAGTLCAFGPCRSRDDATLAFLARAGTTYFLVAHEVVPAPTSDSFGIHWQTLRPTGGENRRVAATGGSTASFADRQFGSSPSRFDPVCGTMATAGMPEDGYFFATCPSAGGTISVTTCDAPSRTPAASTAVYVHTYAGPLTSACSTSGCGATALNRAQISGYSTTVNLNLVIVDSMSSIGGYYSTQIRFPSW